MKILHISDTHGKHDLLKLHDTKDIELCIHSGDSTNYHDIARNFHEFERFVDWYSKVDIPNKVYVAGNHDAFLYNVRKDAERILRDAGIEYLNYESLTVNGYKIYGYPTTPRFGDWYFMADRGKIQKHTDTIHNDTQILINHGMPKGILDLTENIHRNLEMVGDKSLLTRINKLEKLKLFCGGHIHNNKHITNTGLRIINGVTFSNAAMVKDGEFEKQETYFHGNIITLI